MMVRLLSIQTDGIFFMLQLYNGHLHTGPICFQNGIITVFRIDSSQSDFLCQLFAIIEIFVLIFFLIFSFLFRKNKPIGLG